MSVIYIDWCNLFFPLLLTYLDNVSYLCSWAHYQTFLPHCPCASCPAGLTRPFPHSSRNLEISLASRGQVLYKGSLPVLLSTSTCIKPQPLIFRTLRKKDLGSSVTVCRKGVHTRTVPMVGLRVHWGGSFMCRQIQQQVKSWKEKFVMACIGVCTSFQKYTQHFKHWRGAGGGRPYETPVRKARRITERVHQFWCMCRLKK